MSDIRVRVGQENAIKVISSASGYSKAIISTNVIGGIASVTQLTVSGISTFSNNIYYTQYSNANFLGGIAYFDSLGKLASTARASVASTSETNFVLSTNNVGTPSWSNVIDGGTY